jgi:hypothetical protein
VNTERELELATQNSELKAELEQSKGKICRLEKDIQNSRQLALDIQQVIRCQAAKLLDHEIIGPILRLKIEARNWREIIDDMCEAEAEGDAELLRIVKKWIQRHNEENEEILDELMQGKH